MKRGYNELVGLTVTFSNVIKRYSLTHHYRWSNKGVQGQTGTLRGYDMRRHIPVDKVTRGLRDAYASAILSIWQLRTRAQFTEYYQFNVNATPTEMGFRGRWRHFAER